MAALGCARYEIAVHDGDTGRVRRAILTADEAMLQITRLVALNDEGGAITVRPATGLASGLVVLDALDAAGLRRLRDDGHAPVVVTGTTGATDGRYQSWLRLSAEDLDPHVAAEVARALQARYGRGQDGADGQGGALAHAGPLAGFIDHTDHTGARAARGENGADMTRAGTHVSATPVTVRMAGDEPGRVTPAAARARAEAEERVVAQREAEAREHEQEQERGGRIARWGGRLVEAVAEELARDDEPTRTAGEDDYRRRRRPGRVDDERDGRGDR